MRLGAVRLLDEYDLRARLLPALIVSAPALAAVIAYVPATRSWWSLLAAPLEVAFVYLLVCISRTEGCKLQDRLFAAWGGAPTTGMLRHRDPRLDPVTRERYKAALTKLTGIAFPTAAEEQADPARADSLYRSAVKQLLELRRGRAYRLVFAENCKYGFARNLLGLKRLGLALSGTSLAAGVGTAWFVPERFAGTGEAAMLLAITVAVTLVVYVTPETVRHHAEAFATALLRTCEPSAPPRNPRSRKTGASADAIERLAASQAHPERPTEHA